MRDFAKLGLAALAAACCLWQQVAAWNGNNVDPHADRILERDGLPPQKRKKVRERHVRGGGRLKKKWLDQAKAKSDAVFVEVSAKADFDQEESAHADDVTGLNKLLSELGSHKLSGAEVARISSVIGDILAQRKTSAGVALDQVTSQSVEMSVDVAGNTNFIKATKQGNTDSPTVIQEPCSRTGDAADVSATNSPYFPNVEIIDADKWTNDQSINAGTKEKSNAATEKKSSSSALDITRAGQLCGNVRSGGNFSLVCQFKLLCQKSIIVRDCTQNAEGQRACWAVTRALAEDFSGTRCPSTNRPPRSLGAEETPKNRATRLYKAGSPPKTPPCSGGNFEPDGEWSLWRKMFYVTQDKYGSDLDTLVGNLKAKLDTNNYVFPIGVSGEGENDCGKITHFVTIVGYDLSEEKVFFAADPLLDNDWMEETNDIWENEEAFDNNLLRITLSDLKPARVRNYRGNAWECGENTQDEVEVDTADGEVLCPFKIPQIMVTGVLGNGRRCISMMYFVKKR